jgi:hypothetical protein
MCVIQRNVSAAEVRIKARKKEEKAQSAKNAKNTYGDNIALVSVVADQAQLTPESRPADSTSSAAPADPAPPAATTPAAACPNAIMSRAGLWTRFRLFLCCSSAPNTDSHH